MAFLNVFKNSPVDQTALELTEILLCCTTPPIPSRTGIKGMRHHPAVCFCFVLFLIAVSGDSI